MVELKLPDFDCDFHRAAQVWGQAADACAKAGNIGEAIEITHNVEQLAFEINTLLRTRRT